MIRVGLLFFGLTFVGCSDDFYPQVCTQIGCDSGFRIEIEGDLPDRYTVTLEAPGAESRTMECPSPFCGPSTVVVVDFAPETVEIRLEGEGLDYVETFEPDYTTIFPNGPDCPPECRQATIRIEVP